MFPGKIFFNTSVQLLGRFLGAGLSFLTTLLFARTLGAHYFGEYTKITSFIGFFYLGVDFGMNAVFLQIAAEDKVSPDSRFVRYLGMRLFGSVMMALLCIVLGSMLSFLNAGFTNLVVVGVVLGSLSIPLYAVEVSVLAILQSRLRYDLAALADICGSAATLVVIWGLLVVNNLQVQSLVLAGVLALMVGMLLTALLCLRFMATTRVSISPVVDIDLWRKTILRSIPLGLVLLCNVLYFRLDLLILSHFRSSSEIGQYALAYKFFDFAIALPTFFMNSLYPSLLSMPHPAFAVRIKRVFGMLFLASLIVTALFWIASPLLVFIKREFLPSVFLLRILTLSVPVFFLTSPLMWIYIVFKKQKQLIFIYAAALFFNTLANWYLIPRFGTVASAVLTGLSELVVLVLGYWGVREQLKV